MIADRRAAAVSGALVALLMVAVCVRSWVPVTTYAHFDSDQAVFGLMGRDLVAGRGFPVFMYGQRYMLAVSVWLCAPLFAWFGATVTTLKLPLLAMNLAVVAMLWRGLRSEPGLGPWGTTLAILPFAAPSPVTSSRLVEHAGGNIEPFVFVLAMFLARRRPIVLGLLLGVAFLNREYTLIGFIALLLMDAVQGTLRRRFAPHLMTVATAAATVISVRVIARWSTSFGGGGPLYRRPGWDNIAGFFGQQLPTLVGGAPRRLLDFNIISRLTVGHYIVTAALIAWLIVLAIAFVRRPPLDRRELNGMSAYLVLVGVGQAAAFLLLCYAPRDKMLVRYVLLTLLALCGLVAFAWRRPALRGMTAGLVLLMTVVNGAGTVRLLREYAGGPPPRDLNVLAEVLVQRGVRYVETDYWTAYDVAFVTGERVVVSTPHGEGDRMARYRDDLAAHRGEAFTIMDRARPGCDAILRWYLCPPWDVAK